MTTEAIALEERRLQELSLTPKSKMTEEQRKEYNRLHNRKSRRKTTTNEGWKKLLDRAERAETQEQFWYLNRAEESPKQLEEWGAQQEVIHDMLHWMANVGTDSPADELYVSLEDGLDLLNDSITTRGFIKDGFSYKSKVLQDFIPDWAIWATTDFKDVIWGAITPYWKDSDRLTALIEENEPTRVWALYGIKTAVPEYHYNKWKQKIRETLPVTSPVLELLR